MNLFSKNYEDLVVTAIGYIQLQELNKARTLLEKAIKKKKNDSDPYMYMGYIYLKENNEEKASFYLQKADEISGGLLKKMYFNQGVVFFKRNMIDDAMEAFSKVRLIDKEDKFARYYLGQIFSKSGNYHGAIQEFFEILEKFPEDIQTLESLGFIYFDLKMAEEGIDIFKKLHDLDPSNNTYLFNIGYLYKFKGDYNIAIEYFEKAIKINSNNYLLFVNLGEIFKHKKMYDKAESMFEKAIEKFPMDFMVHYDMGLLFLEQKKYDEGLKYFVKAYELNDDDIYTINKLAFIYCIMNDDENSEKFYQLSILKKPDEPYSHYKYGEFLIKKGLKERARIEFKKTLELEPNYIIARLKLKDLEN